MLFPYPTLFRSRIAALCSVPLVSDERTRADEVPLAADDLTVADDVVVVGRHGLAMRVPGDVYVSLDHVAALGELREGLTVAAAVPDVEVVLLVADDVYDHRD